MQLNLNGYTFQELFSPAGLDRLDQDFIKSLARQRPELVARLRQSRHGRLQSTEYSDLIIELAPCLEEFVVQLFDIEEAVLALQCATLSHDPIFDFKKRFVLKKVKRSLNQAEQYPDFETLHASILSELPESEEDLELRLSRWGLGLLAQPENNSECLELLLQWCVQALRTNSGRALTSNWSLLRIPKKLDYGNLVEVEPVADDPYQRQQACSEDLRQRQGFALTDQRMPQRQVMSEINYCVYCHDKEGDFCSKGFPVKKGKPEMGLKTNPLNEALTGCPLEEKISEMHYLKKNGYSIAALATVMIDNPMCPATGHRICNDCMKACIYQKQVPVDIPQIETRVLTEVLALPWGVEIYDLLTRWNPLRQQQYCIKPYNGLKVLVMGMGPAGFTLAHHLLMEGCAVVGCDGLKLEPLSMALLDAPIKDYRVLEESLATRVNTGFGGVAEYGITSRWDKNFLKLILISLRRKQHFQCYGSVRFGGTLTIEKAWELGFDHLAVAVGAGLPRELVIPNSLAPGMRQANDFLMALQLTGASKDSSLANLQIRLPAVIIGGGLTGIDAATEVQAYYLVQIEKAANRYRTLCEAYTVSKVREQFSQHELEIIDEYLEHARQLCHEREQARAEQREADVITLLRRWGGVSVVYRRSMQESPAYRRNYEELAKALEEGIYYAEGLSPNKVVLDQYGHVKSLECVCRLQDEDGIWMESDQHQLLPARCILVATGAKPNVAYEFEHRGTLLKKQFEYQRFDWVESQLRQNTQHSHVKMPQVGPFSSYDDGKHTVSILGDTHPIFHGSVVNAIASAKRIYPDIIKVLTDRIGVVPTVDGREYQAFQEKMQYLFTARVSKWTEYSAHWLELEVRAPLASQQFQPGLFYRLQTYESLVGRVADTSLHSEALALIAIKRPGQDDCLSFIINTQGVSARLMTRIAVGERLSLMGPSGNTTTCPSHSTVVVIGGAMAAVHLLSVGYTLKEQHNRIIFVAQLASPSALFCKDEIVALCDHVIWCCEDAVEYPAERAVDWVTATDPVKAIVMARQQADIAIEEAAQVIVVGNAALIKQIQTARSEAWRDVFIHNPTFIAAVHGPMQCMLKGVCAQCLQWQIDPVSKQRTKAVYACSWHNQPLELVDSGNLDERLQQNSAQENLSRLWLEYLEALAI